MEEKWVYVGIFWAMPSIMGEYGWEFCEIRKKYPLSAANDLGFIDYPYSHYEKWDDAVGSSERKDCYYYPRGRVLYNVNTKKHRIFADECLSEFDLFELADLFEMEEYEVCRDEHYVSTLGRRLQQKSKWKLSYDILRGEERVGENLIEISYGKTKLLVELGKPLSGEENTELTKSVLDKRYDAVIVSHYHDDHAGLIGYKKDCQIFIGSGAYRVLKAMAEYKGQEFYDNITTYGNGKSFVVGGIKITPFLCDHSAFDSYMLLFEADGNSILYTGDFRFHGRKSKENLLSRLPHKVNTLIYEGTNIKSDKKCYSESELEDRAVEIMKGTDKPIFILQSSTNIDRLVSFYRAAKRSERIFYEDNYTALIATAVGGKIPRPDEFSDVYAYTPTGGLNDKQKDMFFEIKNKRGAERIVAGKKFAMSVRSSSAGYMKKLSALTDLSGAVLIYSVWSGYKQQPMMAEFLDTVREMGIEIRQLHTSGHASAEDIKLLKETVCADEYISVHTCSDVSISVDDVVE